LVVFCESHGRSLTEAIIHPGSLPKVRQTTVYERTITEENPWTQYWCLLFPAPTKERTPIVVPTSTDDNMQHAVPVVLPQHSGNVEEELQRIKMALHAVFSPHPFKAATISQHEISDQRWWDQRVLADRYLTSFQSSSIAWMVCDRLLLEDSTSVAGSLDTNNISNSTSPEAVQQQRFFAAQTLHTKCRSDIHQLPVAALPSLRDSLLHNLTTCSLEGDVALTNRLAMCVSALAVQMSWTTIVTDLLQTTTTDPQKGALVMQLFKVLPEECASDRLILVDENIRYHMRDHLISSSSDVFAFLQQWTGLAESAYQVLFSWIRHVPVQPQALMHSNILDAAFRAVTEESTMEAAADVIIEIYRMYPSHHNSNEGLVQKMIPLSSKLPFEQALASDDEDVLRTYCRIITEMGESYMSLILSNQYRQASQLVGWVLKCSLIKEKEIASITLHFWFRLVIDMEAVEPYDFRQNLTDHYAPFLFQLVDVCTTHLMTYPQDFEQSQEYHMDEINRDRFYVSETIEDCCRLMGGQQVLHQLGNILRTECRRAGNSIVTQWQGVESCLNAILSVHKFIPSDEAEVLPFCFEMLTRLPTDIHPLRFTMSKMIGKYASWLVVHPQLLQPLLPFLAQGLSITLCAQASAVAIKELCECSNQQMSMGEPVLQLYTQISASPGLLDLKDELEVLEGVCRAISRQVQVTHEDSSIFVQRIIQPIGGRLSEKLNSPSCNPKQDVNPELDRLTVVVRFLSLPKSCEGANPIVDVVQSSWSLLETASNRYPQDTALVERICRFHKHALRTCGPAAYAPMIDPLMKQLVRSYERSHQAPFLYAASICVTEYGLDPSYSLKLFNGINAMATVSFTFLRSLDDLTQHPDVVEELFYLMGRMIQHCPEPLVMSPLLHSLFQCAAVGMQLDHRDANKGTLNFLENSISYGLSLQEQQKHECQQALERVVAAEGQLIVKNLMLSLMGELPAYTIDRGQGSVAGILWKINLLMPSMVGQWMTTALEKAPERPRIDFTSILSSGLPREEFNVAVRGFMSACRRKPRIGT
jgi:transportin-3